MRVHVCVSVFIYVCVCICVCNYVRMSVCVCVEPALVFHVVRLSVDWTFCCCTLYLCID